MPYRVLLKKQAEKELKKIPEQDHKRILRVLIDLEKNPFAGKKLAGKFVGFFSIRVWPYRIVYYIVKSDLVIVVIRIGHRQGAYNE